MYCQLDLDRTQIQQREGKNQLIKMFFYVYLVFFVARTKKEINLFRMQNAKNRND